MSKTRKAEAHTELRRANRDKSEHDMVEKDRPEDAAETPANLKPRTPADKIPNDGDEVDDLFNDVPV